MATDVDIKQLFEAGAHFGHKTARWHPRMAPYIHSKRGDSHIIDLAKTVERLQAALDFVQQTVAEGKQVLFVGTKRQAQDIIKTAAEDVSMPYVTERWIGGLLTNVATISARIKHLKDLELRMDSGALADKYSKLEVQRFQEEIDAMNHLYGGVKHMAVRPGLLFVVDILHEANAVREAKKLGIPVVAIVDTNADPSQVMYPIPSNDDAIKTIALITNYLVNAIRAGQAESTKKAKDDNKEITENSKQTTDSSQKPTTESKKQSAADKTKQESE